MSKIIKYKFVSFQESDQRNITLLASVYFCVKQIKTPIKYPVNENPDDKI